MAVGRALVVLSLLAAIAGLSACGPGAGPSTGSLDLKPPDAAHARALAQSYVDIRHGALDQATSRLSRILADVDRTPRETYIAEGVYRMRAEAANGLAWVALDKGDVFGAKRQFNEAIRKLAEDEQQHIAMIRENDAKQQAAQTVIGLGLIGVATAVDYRNVQAGTYVQSTSALTSLNNSGLITELTKPVDSTDRLVKFVGDTRTDTDGVRMIVMPGVNGPLSAIGRVRSVRGSCTGAMVGPRAVLTAAHCLTDMDAGVRFKESEITFSIESANHTSTVRVTAIHMPTPVWSDKDFDNDWAVLEVERNPSATQEFLIADDTYNPARTGSRWNAALSRKLHLAGYSSDLNDGRFLTLAANCSWSKVRTPSQGEHRCPSWKGASGAPVLVKHGKAGSDSYQVVGIHVWSDAHNTPLSRRGMRLLTKDVADLIRAVNRS